MFKGRVEKVSHEGGLLVSYTGACPALGSVMVDSGETYIGKVDGVIGNLKESLVHIAHLDRKANPQQMVGLEITIRTKRGRDFSNSRENRSNDNRRGHDDRRGRDDRRERNDRRGRDDRRSRDDRRGGDRRNRDDRNRGRSNDRRDNRRPKQDTHSRNDWICGECGNSNFSFRTECNRCSAPKGRGRAPSKQWKGNDRRPGDRREEPQPRAGDWECPQCGKSNFAKRNECFGCGRSKRVGGPKKRGHHRKLKDPPPLHSVKYGRGNRRN